jgi:hypothetical protein
MKQSQMIALAAMGLGAFSGCSSSSGGSQATGGDSGGPSSSGGPSGSSSSSGGSSGSSGGSSGSSGGTGSPTVNTPEAINAYLAWKTMVMTGADIPPYPVGFDENVVYPPNISICYNTVTILPSVTGWTWTWVTGTLLPVDGSTMCDHQDVSKSQTYTYAPVTISNVQGNATCFDINFSGAANPEGRASISADGKTVSLEVYNPQDLPTGDTCADGNVGSHTVSLKGTPVTGDAVAVFRIQ